MNIDLNKVLKSYLYLVDCELKVTAVITTFHKRRKVRSLPVGLRSVYGMFSEL